MFNPLMVQEMAKGILESLMMTLTSTLIGYVLGLPLGILLVVTSQDGISPRPGLNRVLSVIVNLFRSVPFLILLVCVLGFTRLLVGTTIGSIAVIPPLVIAAAPYVGRMVEGALKEVDHGVIEAAQSMGATNWQIITRVLLPESLPSLLNGATIVTTTILSYSAMAGALGGGGLGAIAINYGYYRYQEDVMWVAVVLLVILVQIFQVAGDKLTPAETAEAPAQEEAQEEAPAELVTIKVGASITPHAEILNAVKDDLAAQGYNLEVVEFTDYVLPNTALEEGDLDANYFQHGPYLDDFNAQNGTHLVAVAAIHYEPFGIYAGKTTSLEELADGATVAIPNDGTNEARALLLLEAQGLIKLNEGVTFTATKLDIAENPKNLDIQEIEAAQLPRSLQDVDLAVINGNYAIQAGLKVSDALAVEDKDSIAAETYANVLVVKEGNEETDATKALIAALQSETVREFIDATYAGAVIAKF